MMMTTRRKGRRMHLGAMQDEVDQRTAEEWVLTSAGETEERGADGSAQKGTVAEAEPNIAPEGAEAGRSAAGLRWATAGCVRSIRAISSKSSQRE